MGTKYNRQEQNSSLAGQFFGSSLVKKINEYSSSSSIKKYWSKLNKYFFGREMIFLDTDGTVISWSDSYKRLQGYSEREILGQSLSIFYMPLDRQLHLPEKLIDEAQKKGSASHAGKWVRKDGSTFFGRMVVRAIRSLGNNELLGFSEIIYPAEDESE